MLRYMHAKDRDAAIRGALVLADLKAHDGRAALPVLWEEGPAAAGLTETRVLQVLVLEAQRQMLQSSQRPRPASALSRTSPCSVMQCSPDTPPHASPGCVATPSAT